MYACFTNVAPCCTTSHHVAVKTQCWCQSEQSPVNSFRTLKHLQVSHCFQPEYLVWYTENNTSSHRWNLRLPLYSLCIAWLCRSKHLKVFLCVFSQQPRRQILKDILIFNIQPAPDFLINPRLSSFTHFHLLTPHEPPSQYLTYWLIFFIKKWQIRLIRIHDVGY